MPRRWISLARTDPATRPPVPEHAERCAWGSPFIQMETEGWKRPLCGDCWDEAGQPRQEPAEA